MIFAGAGGGGGGAPGLFSMEFPFRISRPRVPGHPIVSGDIYSFLGMGTGTVESICYFLLFHQ